MVAREPIEPDNPLLGAKNCLITPHIAWATVEAPRALNPVLTGFNRAGKSQEVDRC